MKPFTIIALILFTLLNAQSQAVEAAQSTGGEVLYLHCFRATGGQKVVVDPNSAQDKSPATPPARLIALRVSVESDFAVVVGDRGDKISGRISRNNGSLNATLEGSFGSGFKFSGKVEIEKVFDPELTWFSGAVFPCRCVFSKHQEIESFLKAQAELDAKSLEEATERTRKNQRREKESAEPHPASQESPAK